MTTRRLMLHAFAAGALAALPALAQQEKRVRRLGYISGGSVQVSVSWLAAFREGMTELRWTEGRDYVIDARYADGVAQTLPALATELIASQPDLLLTLSEPAVRVLQQLTRTIPIVFAIAHDPVEGGVAANLRRPGGNATGLTTLARDLGAKRLQLLKEASPRVTHVVMLFEPAVSGILAQVKESEEAAARLGLRFTPLGLRTAADIEAALGRGATKGAQGYMITQGGLINAHQQAISDRLNRLKLPAIYDRDEYAEAGGLMSYGPSFEGNFRRAAGYVVKILKGASPGELPIEQPTKFQLVLNLKTARAIGITFAQSILLRADRVIE